jgi:hypothetical protein
VSYSANVNAGTVTASASYVESANHLSSSDSKPFSIGQKAASVTPNAASKIEGQTDPALSGTLSGFVAADSVTASYSRTSGETVGEYTISAVLSPASVLGNYDITYGTAKFTISAKPVVVAPVWTTKGFFQPVDMGTATNIVYNTVKGGSTVPLKFQVFKDGVEQKDVAVVTGLKPTFVSCTNSPIDDIEVLASGSTALRYDTTAGQFIYNWKTPTALGCYKTSVTLQDGSAITAYFKILK